MKNIEFDITEKQLIDFKKRKYVRQMVDVAIKKGGLSRPEKCSHCKECESSIDAHHVDYGKPYDVIWLCKKCHGLVHRKNHPLNPENNVQTPLPSICDKFDMITISFSIPARNFLAIKKESENTGKNISKLIRDTIVNKFKIKSNQLEFNFYDESQDEQDERVRCMAKDEVLLHRQKQSAIQQIWSERDSGMSRVDERLFAVS